MRQLGKFYGVAGAGGLEISNLPEGIVNILAIPVIGGDPVTGGDSFTNEDARQRLQGTFDSITGLGQSTPTMTAIINGSIEANLEDSALIVTQGPMLVYPDENDGAANNLAAEEPAMSFLNQGYGKGDVYMGYGRPKNGTHYTSGDFMPAVPEGAALPLCSAIQIFPPVAAPNHTQSDIAAFFMNAIPPSEMNLCAPFMEVVVLSQFDPAGLDDSSGNPGQGRNAPMSTQQWMFGRTSDGQALGDFAGDPAKAVKLHNAQYDGLPNGPYDVKGGYSTEKTIEGPAAAFSTAGGMDLFTMPQSLVNANRNSAATNKSLDSMQIKDPFRPYLSVLSFKTKVSLSSQTEATDAGGGGITSLKDETSTLRLKLHDRSRMSDAAALLSPSVFNQTQLMITYGWAHPHSLEIARRSDAELVEKFGDILGQMKVTKIFSPSNIRFSFEDSGEVSIDLDLHTSGMGSFKHLQQITSGPADDDTPIDSYQDMMRQINSVITTAMYAAAPDNPQTSPLLKSLLPIVTNEASGYIPQTAEAKAAMDEWFKGIKAAGILDASSLSGLQSLFDRHSGATTLGATPSGVSALKKLLQQLPASSDPFLRPKFAGNRHSQAGPPPGGAKQGNYVSLGKIIQWFIVNPLRVTKNVSEIQTIYYSCNANAGAAYDFNLASFPIHFPSFKSKLVRHMRQQKNLSVEDFATYLTTFLKDAGAGGYGRTGSNVGAQLGKIYDPDNPPPGIFVPINLNILPVTLPSRNTIMEDGKTGPPILKIHVYDAACQDGGQRLFGDMFRGLNGMVFQPGRRNPSQDRAALGAAGSYSYASNHGDFYNKTIEQFKSLGLLDAIEPSKLASVSSLDATKADNVAKNHLVITPDLQKINNLMTQIMPTIIYGSANTAVERVQVQTITSPETKNLRMLEKFGSGNPDDQADRKKGKSPTVNYSAFPVQVEMETLGCPFLNHSQQYYLNLGTNTDVDGLYVINEIEHSLEPGSFKSSMSMSKLTETNRDLPIDAMLEDILAAFARNL